MAVVQLGRRILAAKYQQGVNVAEMISLYDMHAYIHGCTISSGGESDGILIINHTPPGGPTTLFSAAANGTWSVYDGSLQLDYNGIDDAGLAVMFSTMGQSATAVASTAEFAAAVDARIASGTARAFTNNASRSLTTSTGAVGFQVSATRDALVGYDVTMSTTATIGGASSSTVLLEIAPTNSATAGDWVEIARLGNSQTITLAVALQSVQGVGGRLTGVVPAGYYAKLRQINTGTASVTYNTGQEVLL